MTFMRLIDGNPFAPDDAWVRVAGNETLPQGRPAIVPLARWIAEREHLSQRNAPTGVWLRSDEQPDEILGDLAALPVIALDFPNMNDGRHFSTARLLRERHGFTGELRATGDVLQDQLFFMARCGFDSFELPEGGNADSARAAFGEFSAVYQPATDALIPIPALRTQLRHASAAE